VVCQLPQSPIIAPWTLVLSSVNNASSVIQEDATVNISAQSSWVFSANLEGDDYD
jgi:glycogen operon protein